MCMEKPKNINKLDEDITRDEWDNIYLPMQENLEKYMEIFIVPEVIAFSIADAYNRGGLCNCSFEVHYKSMGDILLVKPQPMEVADKVFEILEIKYCLKVISKDPLTLTDANS